VVEMPQDLEVGGGVLGYLLGSLDSRPDALQEARENLFGPVFIKTATRAAQESAARVLSSRGWRAWMRPSAKPWLTGESQGGWPIPPVTSGVGG
jgi:hypothetical protein